MKYFKELQETFYVSGFGDLGTAKTAQTKLIRDLEGYVQAAKSGKKSAYERIMKDFDSGSVAYALAKALKGNK